jgi:DNA (cytosine-5)-methyltransferase 1
MIPPFTCVDLFSGCGGLSLGLKQAGFKEKLAVEKSDMAAETYYHNLIKAIEDADTWKKNYLSQSVADQAAQGLVVKELAEVLEDPAVMAKLRDMKIDLVAGGPPCQGFSMAGRRNPEDARNKLPWQFLEFVAKVNSKAIIIENVSGMRSHFVKNGKRSPFEDLRKAMEITGKGYLVQPMLLNAMHFGVPQHRPRVFLIGLRLDVAERLGVTATSGIWSSAQDFPVADAQGSRRPPLAPRRSHFGRELVDKPQHLSVYDALKDLGDAGYTGRPTDGFALTMRTHSCHLTHKKLRAAYPVNHVMRRHSERVRQRCEFYQFALAKGISKHILSIPKRDDLPATAMREHLREAIGDLTFPFEMPAGTLVNTFDDFADIVFKLATKKHSQRALRLDHPAPTVVSLPDDFVHPTRPRVPTVRELARFQSFPDDFEFRAKETTGSDRRRFEVPQFTQVGNAVPPILAQALGSHLHELLRRDRTIEETEAAMSSALIGVAPHSYPVL